MAPSPPRPAALPDVTVSVRALAKTYRSGTVRRREQRALDGVTLEVGRGQVFGLLGPNGAGKTTLIKVLLGLIRTFEGEARLLGEPVGRTRPRQRVGYLPEAHRLPPYLTGRQTLELLGQYSERPRAWLRPRIPVWLDRLGIGAAADRKVKEYSKGMQQRLGLAQALIHEPDLIFLDEPTDGVDPVGRRIVREIVAEERDRGATVFINSHLLMEVEQVCDHVVILDRGRVVRSGSMAELTTLQRAVHLRLAPPAGVDPLALLGGLGEGAHPLPDGVALDVDDEALQVAIDRLRGASVAILGIERRKRSLEEAFLQTVEERRTR